MGFGTGFFPWMQMGWWFQSSPACCTHVECLSTLLGPWPLVDSTLLGPWALADSTLLGPWALVDSEKKNHCESKNISYQVRFFYKNMIQKPGISTTLLSLFFLFTLMTSWMGGFFLLGFFFFGGVSLSFLFPQGQWNVVVDPPHQWKT